MTYGPTKTDRFLLGICFRARRTEDGQNGDRRRGVRGSGGSEGWRKDEWGVPRAVGRKISSSFRNPVWGRTCPRNSVARWVRPSTALVGLSKQSFARKGVPKRSLGRRVKLLVNAEGDLESPRRHDTTFATMAAHSRPVCSATIHTSAAGCARREERNPGCCSHQRRAVRQFAGHEICASAGNEGALQRLGDAGAGL